MEINYDEKKSIAANDIIEAVKFAVVSGMYAHDLGIETSASLHLNIRDAMFHYKSLCDYIKDKDEENVCKHYYSLKEHIIRGEKDAIILHAINVLDALSEIEQQKCFEEFTPSEVKQLRMYNHKIRNVILEIRKGGINPDNRGGFPLNKFSELKDYIKEIIKICETENIPLF